MINIVINVINEINITFFLVRVNKDGIEINFFLLGSIFTDLNYFVC